MTTELFKHMAKIDLLQVPYKGGGPAAVGLMSGETHVLITGITGAIPHMRSGRMRGLAVTTKQRSPVLPDLPTMDEAGVPRYDKAGWFGLFAPSAVAAPIIDHVYQSMAKVLKDPATVKRLATEFGMQAVVVSDAPNFDTGPEYWLSSTDQILVTRNKVLLQADSLRYEANPIADRPDLRTFTDAHHNLFRILR
jgi:hypothetical protein